MYFIIGGYVFSTCVTYNSAYLTGLHFNSLQVKICFEVHHTSVKGQTLFYCISYIVSLYSISVNVSDKVLDLNEMYFVRLSVYFRKLVKFYSSFMQSMGYV